MKRHGIFTMTVVLSLICTIQALASEKFVLSATDGINLTVRTYELNRNQIRILKSTVLRKDAGLFNTAVTFRNSTDGVTFDVYYGVCQDIDCVNASVAMQRLDSNLNPILTKEVLPSGSFLNLVDFSTERVQLRRGVSLRLLVGDGNNISERRLSSPNDPLNVAFPDRRFIYTSSEDGKMMIASEWYGKAIKIRPFNPAGPITVIQKNLPPYGMISPTLSGPLAETSGSLSAGSTEKRYRLLLYRGYQANSLVSRIVMQKVEDSTGKFIGAPKAITKYNQNEGYFWLELFKSIVITPEANIVFYNEMNYSCGKDVLKAQVLDPQKGTNIGSPQLLIGCDAVHFGISGIDVAQFKQ